jgi:hypothetical protein
MTPKPDPFLDVRFTETIVNGSITGVCAGYELGQWRSPQLVDHFIDWLPEFALRSGELANVHPGQWGKKLRQAARAIYMTDKYKNRGEFGELLLHIIVRQVFDSIPVISKIYYKDGPNDTVKGFDAVHVVCSGSDLELWLGEVKFYEDINAAITDVSNELAAHFARNYLRTEFTAITNKMEDDGSPLSAKLKLLMSPNTSLDDVFDAVRIPVLLTYDSDSVNKHSKVDAAYKAAFESEIRKHAANFWKKNSARTIVINLILFPLKSKAALVAEFDKKLKTWQAL